ncbi:uncharacterized protein [Amphiura filiformis]|uniref:uncharacterized protein n=1 Tax=Amphiura filiformis TaxID=82378 RepID=UPI003B21D167
MDKESGGAKETPPAEKAAAAEKPATDKPVEEPTVASIVEEDDSDDETPQSYNKLKYHSSKMDLNLRILREEMAHLQDSGNSLSRQIASMYRTFQEMKDEEEGADGHGEEDEAEEAEPNYDQYSNSDVDSQCADGRDDDLDTEDDVNRMSDLETDSSSRSGPSSKRKKQQKRPPPLQLDKPPQKKDSRQDTNGNEIRPCSPPRNVLETDDADDGDEQAQNSDFYPDFETSSSDECSHCLCCSSLSSYSSGMPWKYVDKSASSAAEYDSDSSEYNSDSDDAPLESPMPIYKRLSPSFIKIVTQKKRMSPLGCESPRPSSSRGSSHPSLDDVDEPMDTDVKQKNKAQTKKPDKTGAAVKGKDSTKDNKKPKSGSPKSNQTLQVIEKDTNEKKNVADARNKTALKPKSKQQSLPKKEVATKVAETKTDVCEKPNTDAEAAPATSDDEEEVPTNVKDRIKNFEAQSTDSESQPNERPCQKTKPGPPSVKAKPKKVSGASNSDKPVRHVSKSTFRVKTPADEEGKKRRKPHSSSTIEIPVQYLSTPQTEHNPPDALTFQVRPISANMQSGPHEGPFIITSSPKPKRKVTKQFVQLAPTNDDDSEQTTLRPEPQGRVQPPMSESAEREHPLCPHCHKKSIPAEERKRNVQVLQLQPVPERELPSTPTYPTPQTQITFEAPRVQPITPARIIKVVPAGRQQMIMQRQPSEEPGSVHLRLNMPGQQQGVPIRVGDYIKIPLRSGQARGVRVIFN